MAKKSKKASDYRDWSPADLATLKREFKKCDSVLDLAGRLKRSPGAVRQKAFALGLTRRGPVKKVVQNAAPKKAAVKAKAKAAKPKRSAPKRLTEKEVRTIADGPKKAARPRKSRAKPKPEAPAVPLPTTPEAGSV